MQKRYEELIRFCLLFSTLLKQWNWFWIILFHLPAFIEAGERWLTWFLTRWWTSVLWWRGDIGSDLTFETFETLLKPGPGLTLWRRWGGGGLDSDTERCGMLKIFNKTLNTCNKIWMRNHVRTIIQPLLTRPNGWKKLCNSWVRNKWI